MHISFLVNSNKTLAKTKNEGRKRDKKGERGGGGGGKASGKE
jgi:hypothetical protein